MGDTLQTDRRTRDRVRLFFWAVLTIVCLVAVLVARQQQAQGLQRKADAAQERAIRFTENVLADQLDAKRVAKPIDRSGYDALVSDLKHGLFNDQRVVRVRVWREDGSLLIFTTDDRSRIGVLTSDDPSLSSAFNGELVSTVVTESFAPDEQTTPEPTTLYSTLIPLRATDKADVFGVVQIDNDYALMVEAASHPWSQMQIAFAIVAILCLVMGLVSLAWSHRKEPAVLDEPAGFAPSRRETRAAVKDEKKATAAQAEAATLRDRVKELEGKTKSLTEQQLELERLRGRVAEFEQGAAHADAPDPAEVAQLKAHAAQLEEQARSAESRVEQLRSRVSEMEGQLRVTTDQMRLAQQRADEAPTSSGVVPAPIQAQLDGAAETEQLLRAEVEAARFEIQRIEQEREALVRAHVEETRTQQSQLDEVRVQARLAEEERQQILAEAAKSPTAQVEISVDAEARIKELTQQLERSEAERAMLRAGRPETVYEARNRQLEDDLAMLRDQLAAVGGAPVGTSSKGAVDPGVIASMEARIAAAEERAREAERRLDDVKPRRSRSRSSAKSSNGDASANREADPNDTPGGNGEVVPAEPTSELAAEVEAPDVPEKEPVDGSELRSRLVRSTDARRRGISTPTPVPTPGPTRRR